MFPCEGETGADASGRKPVFLLPVFLLSLPNVSQLMEACFGRVLEQGIEVADDFWGGLGGVGGVVLSVPELSPLPMSRLSDFYILIHLS